MTPASDIRATSATSVTMAPQRISGGGGGGSGPGSDRVEAASPTSFAGVTAQWNSQPDQAATGDQQEAPDQGFLGNNQQQVNSRSWLTPLIFRAALGFAAVSPMQSDWRGTAPTFLSDLQHGLGIYEFNMKITAGSAAPQGSVINRYS